MKTPEAEYLDDHSDIVAFGLFFHTLSINSSISVLDIFSSLFLYSISSHSELNPIQLKPSSMSFYTRCQPVLIIRLRCLQIFVPLCWVAPVRRGIFNRYFVSHNFSVSFLLFTCHFDSGVNLSLFSIYDRRMVGQQDRGRRTILLLVALSLKCILFCFYVAFFFYFFSLVLIYVTR